MALTKEYLYDQIIIGIANYNSSQPIGDTIAKMVHGVEIVTDSATGATTVGAADPIETDWEAGPWVTHGVVDFITEYELAKILSALGATANDLATRVASAVAMNAPDVTPARPLIPDVRLLALSALLDAEKTRRGI